MSESEQHKWVALVTVDDQEIVGAIMNRNLLEVNFGERQKLFEEAQGVVRTVAQDTEPAATIQRVCVHPAQIIALQKPITDLQTNQFLPPARDHSTFEQQLETVRQDLDEAR